MQVTLGERQWHTEGTGSKERYEIPHPSGGSDTWETSGKKEEGVEKDSECSSEKVSAKLKGSAPQGSWVGRKERGPLRPVLELGAAWGRHAPQSVTVCGWEFSPRVTPITHVLRIGNFKVNVIHDFTLVVVSHHFVPQCLMTCWITACVRGFGRGWGEMRDWLLVRGHERWRGHRAALYHKEGSNTLFHNLSDTQLRNLVLKNVLKLTFQWLYVVRISRKAKPWNGEFREANTCGRSLYEHTAL